MNFIQQYIYSLQSLLKISADRILIADIHGKILCANDSFCKMVKKNYPDLKKLSLEKIIGKKTVQELKQINSSKCSAHVKLSIEFSSQKNIDAYVFPLFDDKMHMGTVIIFPFVSKSETQDKNNLAKDAILQRLKKRTDSAWFVADHQRGKYLLAGEGFEKLLGWSADDIIIGGGAFYLSKVHPEDQKKLLQNFGEWLSRLKVAGTLVDDTSVKMVLRLLTSQGKYKLFESETSILEKDESGLPRFFIGSYVPFADMKNESKENERKDYIKVIDGKTFIELDHISEVEQELETMRNDRFNVLSSREREILQLVVDGLSSEEISEKSFVSIHTINMHRKQIMKKLGVKSLAEMIRLYYTN